MMPGSKKRGRAKAAPKPGDTKQQPRLLSEERVLLRYVILVEGGQLVS